MKFAIAILLACGSLMGAAITASRPRILLTTTELTRQRAKCAFHATTAPLCTGSNATEWTAFKTKVLDPYLVTTPPSATAVYAASFAWAYAVTGYSVYGDRAEALAATSASSIGGSTTCTNPNQMRDTVWYVAGLYDWAHDKLSAGNKTAIQEALAVQTSCPSSAGTYDYGSFSTLIGGLPGANVQMGSWFASVWSWIALFGDIAETAFPASKTIAPATMSRTTNVLTATTSTAHGFQVGWPLGFTNCTGFSQNGGIITSTPDTTTLVASITGSDASCTGAGCGSSCRLRSTTTAPQLRYDELRTRFLETSPSSGGSYITWYGGAGAGAPGPPSAKGGAYGEGVGYDGQTQFMFPMAAMAILSATSEDLLSGFTEPMLPDLVKWYLHSASPDGSTVVNSAVPLTFVLHSPPNYGDEFPFGPAGHYAMLVALQYSILRGDTTTAGLAQWALQADDGAADQPTGLLPLATTGGAQTARDLFMDLAMKNSSVSATDPSSLDTGYVAYGTGRFTARNYWNRDATWIYGSCPPPYGGHSQGDCLNLHYYRNGQMLIQESPGYDWDATALHVSLTADGRGNFGDGASGTKYANGKISAFSTSASYTYAKLDGTGVYRNSQSPFNIPTTDGVLRHMLYLPPDTLVVADQVNYASTYPTVPTAWFWPCAAGTPTVVTSRITCSNGGESVFIDVVEPASVTIGTIGQDRIAVTGMVKGATTELTTTRRVARTVGASVTGTGFTGDCTALNGAHLVTAVASNYYSQLRFSIDVDTSSSPCVLDGQVGYVGTSSSGAGYTRAQYITPSLKQNDYGMVWISQTTAPTRLTGTNVIAGEQGSYVVFSPIGVGVPTSFSYSGFNSSQARTHRGFVKASTAYTVNCTSTPGTCSIAEGAGTTSSSAGILEFNTSGGAGVLTSFTVTCPTTPITAGVSQNCTATAKDELGNTLTSYAGSPTCTSADPQAVIGSCASFVSGAKTVSLVLKTAGGGFMLTVTDGSATGSSAPITVDPAAASACTASGFPTPRGAGISAAITANFLDAYGNAAIPSGNNTLTSSDGSATLPAAAPCGAASCDYTVTLNTVGTQSITVTNAAPYNCQQAGISVTSGATAPIVANYLFGNTSTVAAFVYSYAGGTCDLTLSPNADYSSPVYSATDGGTSGYRAFVVTGLTAATIYYQKLVCQSQESSLSITTAISDKGSQTVGFRNAIAATNAALHYGPISASTNFCLEPGCSGPTLTTTTSNVSCGSGCNVTGTLGSGIYAYRLQLDAVDYGLLKLLVVK